MTGGWGPGSEDLARAAAPALARALDDPESRVKVYCAAMLALRFCAAGEGWPRFRRWLADAEAEMGVSLKSASWAPQHLEAASRVLAAWTIMNAEGGTEGGET